MKYQVSQVTSLSLFNSLLAECFLLGLELPSDLTELQLMGVFRKHSIHEARLLHKDYPGLLSSTNIPF